MSDTRNHVDARLDVGVSDPHTDSEMDRRQFVERSVGTLLGRAWLPLLTGCASLATHPITPVDGRLRLRLDAYPQLSAAEGSVMLLPVGSDVPVYVMALGEGRFAALSPICTHRGCTVQLRAARLVCPCHGSTYERDGRVVRGPARKPLTRYPVELTGGEMIIDLRQPA